MAHNARADSARKLTWRKSSFSGPQGGECVEVAAAGGRIQVRDSKDPDGARLAFPTGAWAAFLAGAKTGEFDDLAP